LTITEWTDNNYQPLKEACQRISEGNPLAEELLHYVLSEFLLKKEVNAIIQSGGGFYYCLRMATNSWKSTTSPFYRTYRDPNLKMELPVYQIADEETNEYIENEPEHTPEELLAQIETAMDNLGWYEKELLKVYADNNGNASLVSRLTKIPRTSINLTIKKVKFHLTKTLR
jgi:hypothetical protein